MGVSAGVIASAVLYVLVELGSDVTNLFPRISLTGHGSLAYTTPVPFVSLDGPCGDRGSRGIDGVQGFLRPGAFTFGEAAITVDRKSLLALLTPEH